MSCQHWPFELLRGCEISSITNWISQVISIDDSWLPASRGRTWLWRILVISGVQWTSPVSLGEVLKAAPSQASCSPAPAMEIATPTASTITSGPLINALSVVPSDNRPECMLDGLGIIVPSNELTYIRIAFSTSEHPFNQVNHYLPCQRPSLVQ